jgi:hypothetical protein
MLSKNKARDWSFRSKSRVLTEVIILKVAKTLLRLCDIFLVFWEIHLVRKQRGIRSGLFFEHNGW